ncbi:DNA polymerase I [Holospora curviuscula]|uniref:DNA polymerase I n=1 Tax=Holospora curviuscula TaxID=1082868 RepID=A0A2S5R9C4_9PROT|nr:DNA polymerase I [Holospora curviuscula]PPE03893.1 DNA polymerase I, thermostable [Holospora curviuscula]
MNDSLSISNNIFYLVDASGFLFRSFFALPALTTTQNRPIGALLGLCNMLLKIWETHEFTHWALVLDSKEPTFRHELMPSYKSQRKHPPEALLEQFSLLPHLCESFSIPYVIYPGFEADDLMVSYGKWALSFAQQVVLVSSDKDLMQAVTPEIRMYDPVKVLWVNEATVEARWGGRPSQIPDIQGLAGDPSDHIPGIPGIGLKTAATWIKEAGSLEAVLEGNINALSQHKRDLIHTFKDQARLCCHIARLRDDVPIVHSDLQPFQRKFPDPHRLEAFLDEMELKRLKRRLTDLGWLQNKPPLQVQVHLWSPQALSAVCVTYMSWLQDSKGSILGVVLFNTLEAMVVPFGDFQQEAWKQFWNSETHLKVSWDILSILRKLSYAMPKALEDLRVLEYMVRGCHSEKTAQDTIIHCLSECPVIDTVWGLDIPEYLRCYHSVHEAVYGIQAYHVYRARLQGTLYHTLDLPLLSCLYGMEKRGIGLDIDTLTMLSRKLSDKMTQLEKKIYTHFHSPINLASPKQLAQVLFEDLGWPKPKKGKSGQYSTDSSVLETYGAQGYTLAQDILEWRHYAKLKQSYTDTLPLQVNLDTGRIHSSFSMVTTSTGRLASFNPNLQHIPISSVFPIRSAFRPAPGYVFLSLDYSQIELRLLAHMGSINTLIHAFQRGHDVHHATAQALFHTDEVSSEYRKRAKTINFGILYGMSAFGLAQQLNVPPQEAREYIHRYFELYPGIRAYMQEVEGQAQKDGYVRTLWGRKCTILDIHSTSSVVRQGALRQAINAPLQGTCADFMKKAMLDCQVLLNPDAYLLLQIHDEMLLEVPESRVEILALQLQSLMEKIDVLQVPLKVNYYWGKVWL